MTDEYKGTTVKELKTSDVTLTSSIKLKKNPGKPGIAVFYYDWCGFCVKVKPELIKLSKKIPVYAFRIDDPKASAVPALYGITSAPNLRFVDAKGVVKRDPYYGDRTVAALTAYVKEKSKTGGGKKCKCSGNVCNKKCMKGGAKPKRKVTKKKVTKKKPKKVVKKVTKKKIKKRTKK